MKRLQKLRSKLWRLRRKLYLNYFKWRFCSEMKSRETHPEILMYYKQMSDVLEKEKSPFLQGFLKAIETERVFEVCHWLCILDNEGKLPPEINEPLTNLYWSIR